MSVDEARAELAEPAVTALPRRQHAAMQTLDEHSADDAEYLQVLHGMIWRPGYTVDVREAALKRLEQRDLDNLKQTIRRQLPRMTAWGWLSRLCEIIGERGWDDLTPALVSSWARPANFIDEENRPEFQTLVKLHGEQRVVDVIFDLFLEARLPEQHNLRARCWDLMHRLGERGRLVSLVTAAHVQEDDALLIDLRAGADDLGIIPRNREEILWLRKLREPKRAEFWSEAVAAVQMLPEHKRLELELRDLPIIVAAKRHEPELLETSAGELYDRLAAHLRTQRRHTPRTSYAGVRRNTERLHEHRDVLTWGDLAAMLLAVRAFQVPEMVDHLFDYAERDRVDTTTEYGGVIALDERGRFELLEFQPRIRRHAHEFIAPQEMFDAGYTALFHFHNHAQRHRNADHAGPGLGDLNYADNTRANCLVFTFINRDTLNMDFYRHGGVVVDLGEVTR